MHIVVIGAGSMGCLYGANLARAGADVTFVDLWEEQVNAINAHGLQMDGLHGAFTAPVQAFTRPDDIPKADIALIMVNAYATPAAAETARGLLKDTGFALTLQNGLGNIEALEAVLGEHRTMAGLSFHSADLQRPGAVRHTNKGPTYLGEFDGRRTARLDQLEELMEQADMQPVVETDIMATIWGKFVHNCGINALCAATDLRPGHIQDVPALDQFQSHIIHETLALVKARDIALPGSDPLAEIKAYCARKFHRVSMLQHLARRCQTEIDALNGYVVRESRKLGLPCPYSESLTALIKGRQYLPAPDPDHNPR